MLTRCTACQTTFKVSPEQLKARGGKVRCGKCQTVFNALDSLVETAPEAPPAAPAEPAPPATVRLAAPEPTPTPEAPAVDASIDILLEPKAGTTPAATSVADAAPTNEDAEPAAPASPEAVRDAAVAVGLVAVRETTEIPGYNKWAEGAFTTPVSIAPPSSHPAWPFVLSALLLLLALAGQAAHHFRAELAITAPSLRPTLEAACAALNCDIPLPRHAELVSIETSDLQSDQARTGVLMLTATLKNRAAYAQAWPLLEITLTDARDNAVLRRVLQPADYLPAKADPTLFPPNGESDLRLWLEAREIAAAGYRLYVFYP